MSNTMRTDSSTSAPQGARRPAARPAPAAAPAPMPSVQNPDTMMAGHMAHLHENFLCAQPYDPKASR